MNQTRINTKEALPLLMAGKAIVTFQSQDTGAHFTYRISKAEDADNLFFCSLLTGTNNEGHYTYFGIVRDGNFRTTKKSKMSDRATGVLAFNYVLNHLKRGSQPKVDIFHEGCCCRCGRTLTTPESVARGLGPFCAGLTNNDRGDE